MNELLIFFNKLSRDERDKFLLNIGTTENYIRRAVCSNSLLGAKLCAAIEISSSGKITRKMLRPRDYAEIWIELADA